ncbi:hypothetical protein BEH94_04455 [Candidatus Altiarchaeales archaeon WOR_SM1_SCG]|nr:hypothetical protein BEH94_04455 [Candidatus Altiarchaeales archaeon WOR_SM1_SCG]
MKNTKTNAATARTAAKNGQIKEEIKNLILGKLGVIGIIGLLFMAGIGTVIAADEGLVAYLSFDDISGNTAPDSAGNNDGTIYGAKVVNGVSGKALKFDGTNDYIDCGNDASLDPSITDEITVEAWVKFDSVALRPPPQGQTIVGRWGKAPYSGAYYPVAYILYLSYSTHGTALIRWNINNKVATILDSPSAAVSNRWYYVVGVADSNSARLYIDGSLVATSSGGVSSINSPKDNLRVGYEDSGPSPLNGTIDEVKIYNRALTADEIKVNYNKIKGNGLVAYWSFDDISRNIAPDEAGNNDGIIHGNPNEVNGTSGKALEFDGVDDYVDCGNGASLNNFNQITVEAWIKLSDTNSRDMIAEKHTSWWVDGTTAGWWFARETDNKLTFLVVSSNERYTHSTINVPTGSFVHVVGTYDGTNTKVYINGVDNTGSQQGTGSGSIKNSGNSVVVGNCRWCNAISVPMDAHFNGTIDEVKIYNRALTEGEIKTEYEKHKPSSCTNQCSEPYCVGYDWYDCVMQSDGCYDNINKGEIEGKCGYPPEEPELPCTSGETRCIGLTYFECQNNNWQNRGVVDGKCGYVHIPGQSEVCSAGETKCVGITYFECENGNWQNRGLVDGKCGYTHESGDPKPLPPEEDVSVDVTMHLTFDRTKPKVDEGFELRANFVNMDFKPRKAYITVFLPSGVDILEGFGKVKSMVGGAATYELNLDSNAGLGSHTMRLKANEEGKKEVRLYGIVIDENGGQHAIQQKSETVTVVGETQGGGTGITCDPPYIQVGNECCVDANYNKICDRDDETPDEGTNWLLYVIAGIGALIVILLIAVLVKR